MKTIPVLTNSRPEFKQIPKKLSRVNINLVPIARFRANRFTSMASIWPIWEVHMWIPSTRC